MDLNNQIRHNIAANIAYYRKQKKITQKGLADLLDTKATTVSTWERGASLPDAETIFRLSAILGISLIELYGCDSITDKSPFVLQPNEKEIICAYRKSDSISKEMVHRALGISSAAGVENVRKDVS